MATIIKGEDRDPNTTFKAFACPNAYWVQEACLVFGIESVIATGRRFEIVVPFESCYLHFS